MKKSKLLLILPTTCLLCSCGEPGTDFKEIKADEASQKAKAIEEKTKSDAWEIPSKVTLTLSSSASGDLIKSGVATTMNGEIKAIADFDNSYLYASFSGDYASEAEKDVAKIETWAYKDGDSFIAATSDGTKKTYTKLVNEEASKKYGEMLKKAMISSETIEKEMQEFVSSIELMAASSDAFNYSDSGNSTNFESKFYSKNDGDLKMMAKEAVSAKQYSYNKEITYVISNYLPAYSFVKTSGKNGDADFSAESKMLLDWGKADTVNKPNLKDFQESK